MRILQGIKKIASFKNHENNTSILQYKNNGAIVEKVS